MHNAFPTYRYAQSFMAVLVLFACAFQAHGTDTYDIASHHLQIPTLRIGGATYSNVVLTIGSIITPPSGTSPNGTDDSYNPNNNELTVLAVKVGSTYLLHTSRDSPSPGLKGLEETLDTIGTI